jgi:hypothetical protein
MPLTQAGRNHIAAAIIGDGPPTLFDNSNAHLACGDDATAFVDSQTDLIAATNKIRKAMEATYPQIATNVLTFRSIFASGDANWVWNEWGLFNAAAAGTMMSRKVENLGTKTSAAAWTVTATITVTIGV